MYIYIYYICVYIYIIYILEQVDFNLCQSKGLLIDVVKISEAWVSMIFCWFNISSRETQDEFKRPKNSRSNERSKFWFSAYMTTLVLSDISFGRFFSYRSSRSLPTFVSYTQNKRFSHLSQRAYTPPTIMTELPCLGFGIWNVPNSQRLVVVAAAVVVVVVVVAVVVVVTIWSIVWNSGWLKFDLFPVSLATLILMCNWCAHLCIVYIYTHNEWVSGYTNHLSTQQ